jgi:HNH endonuclease
MNIEHLQTALDSLRKGVLGSYKKPSNTRYLVDPRDGSLWDFKPAVCFALELSGVDVGHGGPAGQIMNSQQLKSRLQRDLPQITLISFKQRRSRRLGLRRNERFMQEPEWGSASVELPERGVISVVTPPTILGGVPSYWALSKRYVRDPLVVEVVLANAKGFCAHCTLSAPFLRMNGEPYLEAHHIIPLSEGGQDVVENVLALCPNCHRMAHHSADGLI